MRGIFFGNNDNTNPFQNNGLTFFDIMQHARGQGNARDVQREETGGGNDDVGLHNITDLILGIRYPVSATDTIEEPNFREIFFFFVEVV